MALLTDWKSGTVDEQVGRLTCWLLNWFTGIAASHDAQGVVVLQKIVKNLHRQGALWDRFGAILNDQDSPIMRQTWESELSHLRLWKT